MMMKTSPLTLLKAVVLCGGQQSSSSVSSVSSMTVDIKQAGVGLSLKEYFDESRNMLMKSDGGPPRWFSPLDSSSSSSSSSCSNNNNHKGSPPLLLSLPGVDGTGLSLFLHHQRLQEIFDIWCLHIPSTDRTPFTDLVKLVETTIRSENDHFLDRPIYLVGESVGACLALAVAARIPHIDLVLLLSNSATSFGKSQLQPLIPILKIIPNHIAPGLPFLMSLMTGVASRTVSSAAEKGVPSLETIRDLSETAASLFSYLSELGDVLTVELVLWKLKMLESACAYSNSCLHSVSAQTLILSSGNDQLLPSLQEGERLRQILPKCQIRTFADSGHALFLEEKFDLVTVIKGAGFYRRAKHIDYALDFLPPNSQEIKGIVDSAEWLDIATSPVMLSTLENGKMVRNLSGIPSEGPVLFVGCHNMLGFEVAPMIRRFIIERNIIIRGVAHPMLFTKLREGSMPDLATYDVTRVMGAVPVSPSNLYKLFSMKSHVLLYPGGVREALHRKGEEYKLFWPEQAEFVRMAARFGATIIPFGAVGEDDYAQLVLDYDDQMKIPFLKDYWKNITDETIKLRNGIQGEVANQDIHMPVFLPKVPGRYYYLFGKPIKTEGRRDELRNKEKANELYIQVKREVEKCLDYCKTRREEDPYRNIIPRLMYQATHGLESQRTEAAAAAAEMIGKLSFPLITFSGTKTPPGHVVFRLVSASSSSVNTSHTHANATVSVTNTNTNLNVTNPPYKKHFMREWERGPPPRWFSPLDSSCSSHLPNSPLLLYLPGIGGSGHGLSLHHRRLGEMFHIWCLHIPPTDRTPFKELVNLVETTVKSQNYQSPDTPIYLVGQSFGACLALSVAARNPDIDIILLLANSATSFNGSHLRPLIPLLETMSQELHVGLNSILNFMTGMASTVAPEISEALVALSSELPEVFSVETLVWKLRLLDSASSYTNSRLHAVKAQTLILSSGKDQLLPSLQEGERLHRLLPKSDIRIFDDSGHMLFMDEDHDLVTILKATSFYRRTKTLDYVLDYLPPSPKEFSKARESHRFVEEVFSPVMLSTLENGKIVRGLSGIPWDGPVLFVGYHMMLGLELAPLIARIYSERGILVRGIAHPMMFNKLKQGRLPDISQYDTHRIMGAVPVSPTNLFKLLKSKSHILLYPGGMREALHRKGEEYKLFWPEQSEFVRMAARFGAKIVPFGVVGEDDIGELIFDYEDQIKIPYLRNFIEELTEEATQLRSNIEGEVANQDVHLPVMRPKLPGRLYYLFGKPIETQGRQQELRNRDKAHELYIEVKSEVESCLSYLKKKRENDPYRSILSRLVFQLKNAPETEIPTFEP